MPFPSPIRLLNLSLVLYLALANQYQYCLHPHPQKNKSHNSDNSGHTLSLFSHTFALSVYFHFNKHVLSHLLFIVSLNSFSWHKARTQSQELQCPSLHSHPVKLSGHLHDEPARNGRHCRHSAPPCFHLG